MPWIVLLLVLAPLCWVAIDTVAALLARRSEDRTHALLEGWSEDFTILVPIYGSMRYLVNIDYLSSYKDKVILCTTSGESDKFYHDLEELTQKWGFRSFRSPYVPPVTTGRRRTGGTIRDRVIRDALMSEMEFGRYTVCIDADTTTPSPLEQLVGALMVSEADFASVHLLPQKKGGLFVQLQRHEYRQAMRLRYLLPWMLSGACHVGRTYAFRDIMSRHSLFFQGNDVETGLLGNELGYTAVHLPFLVDTEVPARFQAWWRQRIAWAGGEFRLFIPNARYVVSHPYLWLYGGLITILMFALRWQALIAGKWILLGVLAIYYVVVLYIHWKTRNWWLLLLPLYQLFYALVLTPIGIVWYLVMAIPEKNFGWITTRRRVEP